MGLQGAGSSIVILLAAVLWLAYLVPTWIRRREYLATERNAVRLQQTLRIMAEMAEIPDEVRVEATAKDAAVQEKIVQREMQRTMAIRRAEEAAEARAAAHRLSESRPKIAASVARHSVASRRLRRSRLVTTAVLVLGLIAGGFGVAVLAGGGGALLLVAGVVVAGGAVAMLAQIAQVAAARKQLAQTLVPTQASPVTVFEADARPARTAAPQVRTTWTPVPVPKPMYLERENAVAPAAARSGARDVSALAAQLREAARMAEQTLRSEQSAPADAAAEAPAAGAPLGAATPPASPAEPAAAVSAVPGPAAAVSAPAPAPAPAPVAAESRFARMGRIDPTPSRAPDLDEVLRRRRAV